MKSSDGEVVPGAGQRFHLRWPLVRFGGAIGAGLLVLPACVSPYPSKEPVAVEPRVLQSETRFRKEYVLAPGDQIEVVVWRVPEVSRLVAIRPDGYVSLPLLDDVMAAGLTSSELGTKLTELFSARLVNPEVTVIASQVRQPVVYVTGDVKNATAVLLRDAPTAMQAITRAGGLSRSAADRDIVLIRLNKEGYLQAIAVTQEIGGQSGPYMALRTTLLQADDVIFVPESGRSQVARFLEDFLNRPLTAAGSVLGIIVNFRLLQELD